MTAPLLGTGTQQTPARNTYDTACGELTVLLRSSEGGRLWNHPLTLTASNRTYHLRFEPAGYGVWAPNYFTNFEGADQINEKLIRKENIQEGVGGALVGVRNLNPREKFAPARGITAPVTATLNFHAMDATLALRRPAKQPMANVQGKTRPLAANFSAPISYYQPPANLMLVGLMAAFRSSHYSDKTGLYFLQPYDPDRIPVVFVHGLISTPFTWTQTINGLQADPEIRKRYQFWVFAYPTGNPILYSAFRLREELARVDRLYPNHRPYVVVGHSMGGMLTHAQVVTVTPTMWENAFGETAKSIFRDNSSHSLVVRAMTFQANRRIKRVVFICSPHRGSEMASGGLGKFGIGLITLPQNVATSINDSLTSAELGQLTGSSKSLPNSIAGLKPSNPGFPVINRAPITIPYHSIIGDRGKGDSTSSTDGVVPYSSSHLDGAQSEVIVPGPHSSCELPQTIAELDRILRLHLRANSASRTTLAETRY
ncbi:hypothetical protein AYO41_01800 [Verrucomicrobia bacterium SCGC AG-212-E04]|nr:hypothetical protein AYO41_01800 [Verrucomicrobia bacterium SCGC AG-212-E04]